MPAAASVAEPASSNKALPEISAMRKAVSPRGTDAVGMPPIKLAKTHSHRTCRWNGRSAPRYAPARVTKDAGKRSTRLSMSPDGGTGFTEPAKKIYRRPFVPMQRWQPATGTVYDIRPQYPVRVFCHTSGRQDGDHRLAALNSSCDGLGRASSCSVVVAAKRAPDRTHRNVSVRSNFCAVCIQ